MSTDIDKKPDLATEINREYKDGNLNYIEHIKKIGYMLNIAKQKMSNTFEKWVDENLVFTSKQARKYLAIINNWHLIEKSYPQLTQNEPAVPVCDNSGKPVDNLSLNTMYKCVTGTGAHVGQNTGEYEWYTPPDIVSIARNVMGKIDTDPATSEFANETIGADTYYTEEDNGLEKEWHGNVWMNPPYKQPYVKEFCYSLIERYVNGEIAQACVLINNCTETDFGQEMLKNCSAVCFPNGRIKFIDSEGNASGAPLQGQMILYFGGNVNGFAAGFSKLGVCFEQ